MLLVVTVIGMSAVNTATFDLLISGNKRASDQAFYIAEAGINEFLGRFQPGATGLITDSAPNNANWRLYLAINTQRASEIGYRANNTNHFFVPSLGQVQLDFATEVRHKVNSVTPPQVITFNGYPVYIAKSYGFTADGGNKVLEIEFRRGPSYDPPSALYTEAPAKIFGASTYIQGRDQCGTNDKPGILTTLPQRDNAGRPNIDVAGNPTISGTPTANPPIPNLDHYSIGYHEPKTRSIENMIDYLKNDANSSYNYNRNAVITQNEISGVRQNWADLGFPGRYSTEAPLFYNGKMNIVYFNMHGNEITLAGGSGGAGILLVNGDFEVGGGFAWYGVIIVRGRVKYTGGGDKNITGGLMAGESVGVDIDAGGNAGIIYCSRAADDAGGAAPPFRVIRWQHVY